MEESDKIKFQMSNHSSERSVVLREPLWRRLVEEDGVTIQNPNAKG